MTIKRRCPWKLTGDPGRWVLTLSLFAETAVKRGDCLKNSHRRSLRSRGNKNALQLASCAGLKRSTTVQTVLCNRFPFLAFACCSNIYRGHWVTWRRWKPIRGEKFSHLSPLVTRTQHQKNKQTNKSHCCSFLSLEFQMFLQPWRFLRWGRCSCEQSRALRASLARHAVCLVIWGGIFHPAHSPESTA